MENQKGIIMKVSGSHAFVMTSDRQFLRIPMQSGMVIGQEVEIPGTPVKTFSLWKKVGLVAASFILAVGVWQTSSILKPDKVSAYVAIDINPSFELAVNEDREVLQANPLNTDAEKIVSQMKLKGKPLEQAVNDLTAEAAKEGFVKPDGEILVTATDAGTSQVNMADLEKAVISTVHSTLTQNGLSTKVGGVLVSESEREEAKKMGLSTGKYALYLQAKANGLDVSVDELKKQSVSEIAAKHGQSMKQIVDSMKGDQHLKDILTKTENEQKEKKKNVNNDKKTQDNEKKKSAESQVDTPNRSNGNNEKTPVIRDSDKKVDEYADRQKDKDKESNNKSKSHDSSHDKQDNEKN